MSDTELVDEENIVRLITRGRNFVEIVGLSSEEEDALYEYLDEKHDGVYGVIGNHPYRVSIDDMSALSLMGTIARYCTQQLGKDVIA